MSGFHFATAVGYFPQLLGGAWVTLQLTALALAGGGILGLLLALARIGRSRILRGLAYGYIEFFRTTPLLVQIVWVYFGLPVMIGHEINSFEAAAIALSLNIASFLSEILRSGLQGVDAGQVDAARVLGLGKIDTLRYVVLPQAVRLVLPPLGATTILLLKGTSLASAIGLLELTRVGQLISSATYRPFEDSLTAVALLYFILCYPIALATRRLESRLKRHA